MCVSMAAMLQLRIREQREWIEDHGGTRSGYIALYGPKGGTIYDADIAELRRLEEKDR